MTTVVTCGDAAHARWESARAAVGGPRVDACRVVALGPAPGRDGLDPLLDGAARLVVVGGDADLAAVLGRLLRRERLDLVVGTVPDPDGRVAGVWGLPTDPGPALVLALNGVAGPAPLIRDDRGAVVAAEHRVGPFVGEVYCDEHRLAAGVDRLAGLAVHPDPIGGGVAVTVREPPTRMRWWRAPREHHGRGRAAQIGCRPATWSRDGVAGDRPVARRSWYPHTRPWQAVLPGTRFPPPDQG